VSTPIPHKDLGKGLDTFHSEDSLPDGAWESLANAESTPQGSLAKRAGYQRFGGLVPLRVKSVARSGTALRFTLQDWVDHSALRSRRIVVFGRTTAAMGSFGTTATTVTFSSFTAATTYIEVTDASSGASSDTAPQLVVYGIDTQRFEAIASDADTRAGWVTHIDAFRDQTDTEWPVVGMDGVMYAGLEQSSQDSSLRVTRAPSLRATASGLHILGPAFWDAAPSVVPTRGYLTHADAAENVVPISAVAYVSEDRVRFTVSGTVAVGSGALATIIRDNLDRLTVTQAPFSILNGVHRILSSTLNSGTLTIDCEISGVDDARIDASSIAAYASIDSDSIVSSTSALPPGTTIDVPYATRRSWTAGDVSTAGDYLDDAAAHGLNDGEALMYMSANAAIGGLAIGDVYVVRVVSPTRIQFLDDDGDLIDLTGAGNGPHVFERTSNPAWEVLGNSGTRFVVGGLDGIYRIAASAVVPGTRTGYVWRVRTADSSATASLANFAEGDVLAVAGDDAWPHVSKRPTVRNVWETTRGVSSIVGDGAGTGTATVTLAAGSTTDLSEDDRLLLVGSVTYAGDILVDEILTSTTFRIATDLDEETDSTSGMEILLSRARRGDRAERRCIVFLCNRISS
jgi:hypothetical protein